MARSRFRRKGKSKFIMIDGYIMRSPAWAELTPNDKAAYLELKWRYDGLNNGRLGLGCRELADTLKVSKDTANRSLKRLMEIGFIYEVRPSGFNVKNRIATEWCLTEYPCDVSGHMPTKDFMRWQPEEKTQSHHRDVQSHHRDKEPRNGGQNGGHSLTTGTVRAFSAAPQSHHRDTYSITKGGSPEYLSTSPKQRGRSAPTQGAEASPRVTTFKKKGVLNGAHPGGRVA